jgi:hypothetical protein
MKTRSLFALLLAFFLVACGSDDDNPSGPSNNVNGTMTATVKGNAWSAKDILIAQKNGAQIGITGDELSNGRDKKIQLNLANITETGTYSLGVMNTAVYIDIAQGTTNQQEIIQATEMAVSGGVTITELSSTKIVGTFNFNTNRGTTVANGAFDVRF